RTACSRFAFRGAPTARGARGASPFSDLDFAPARGRVAVPRGSDVAVQTAASRGDNNMETARVDIRKLQLLNDRIAQTIDALNQVRLSVHAVQQTAVPGVVPGLGIGHTTPAAVNPYFTNPYLAQQSWALNPFNAFASGLGHTTPEAFDPTFA